MRPGQALIGFLEPYSEPEAVRGLNDRKVTSFAMELVPRITRAQSMDALSSMATVAGYQAVLRTLAAQLGVPGRSCVAVEDTGVGAMAAAVAGMRVIGVARERAEAGPLLSAGAALVTELTAADLAQWVTT